MARRPTKRQRIEPRFEPDEPGSLDVRLSADDRAAKPSKAKPRRRKSPSSGKASPAKAKAKSNARRKRGSARKRRGGNGGSRIGRFFRKATYWSLVAGLWAFIGFVGLMGYYAAHLPPPSEWEVPKRPPNVKIVSQSGQLVANRGDTGGEAVRLEQLPAYLPEAVIAIEDRRFRSHFGIDPIGLARAVFVNLAQGRLVQGGSTLTQQLAKNLFLEPDRTLSRKMQEVVMALWLEQNFSKDQILEMYLNRVYLGAGAYGVDAAARRYFDKPARYVTLKEAATLAGLLKAPSRYAPTNSPDLAEDRARTVVLAMKDAGFISDRDAKDAIAASATVVAKSVGASNNYVADWVMDELPSFIGQIDKDVIVDTTIDMDMQRAAEEALKRKLAEQGGKLGVSQGAIVTLDRNGAVKALVGGRDYSKSQFNRAVNAHRQPGSAFKPFVYLAALENGLTPETIRVDEPVTIGKWSPKNYSRKHYGAVTLTQALSYSLNTVAAKLAYEVGPKRVVETARRLGISSPLQANPAIALGTSEVTPLEIAAAYVPLSNGGYGVVPHVIRQIRTVDGKVLYARNGDGPGRVVDPLIVGRMNRMMSETLQTGTGKKASLGERPAGGKTGTSQDFRDGWFIGYTNQLTTAVWLGNDDNSPTRRATGGSLPAEIWKETMLAEHRNVPVAALPGIVDEPVRVAEPGNAGPVPPGRIGEDQGRIVRPEPGRGPLNLLQRIFGG
ncbi:PBP1A family penicillin-binding protein [Stappia sp. GBMRC 2046]|uniref:PBP1A family penicillin-binding protein n=1 Tax=Stappia sediminis TaxID=2692190 RepID=A0A7X3S7F9_9HYPH|nr:transglycosylase domain-containing protein [Stappia sediminis]MXN64741.1 PBP1A family penicillin-binding protein [Stappia sediminis]